MKNRRLDVESYLKNLQVTANAWGRVPEDRPGSKAQLEALYDSLLKSLEYLLDADDVSRGK